MQWEDTLYQGFPEFLCAKEKSSRVEIDPSSTSRQNPFVYGGRTREENITVRLFTEKENGNA